MKPLSLTKRSFYVGRTLVCSRRHSWQSGVLAHHLFDPVFETEHCPECGRAGKPEPITSEDLGGLLTNSDILALGDDAVGVFMFLVTQMFSPIAPDYQANPVIGFANICRALGVANARVADAVRKLVGYDLIAISAPPRNFLRNGEVFIYRLRQPWEEVMPQDPYIRATSVGRRSMPAPDPWWSQAFARMRSAVCTVLGGHVSTSQTKTIPYRHEFEAAESGTLTVNTLYKRERCSRCSLVLTDWRWAKQEVVVPEEAVHEQK